MICLVIFIAFIVLLVYFNYTKNFDYWKKKGVKYEKPIIFLGSDAKIYMKQRSITQLAVETYWKYPKERVVGLFRSSRPELLIRDPEIVKRILVTDFSHFQNRTMFDTGSKGGNPLSRHLVHLNGDLWRLIRQRLTPAFTTTKLKAMFPLIVERAERLYTRIQANAGTPIDARDLMARFSTDFIGACAFGLDMDALTDENSSFRKLSANIFKFPPFVMIKFLLIKICPSIFKNLRLMPKEVEDGVLTIVREVLKQRNYEPSGRNDFIDLLLECKKKGKMIGESMEKFKPDGTPEIVSFELTDELIAAQVFVFFGAGFETSSSTSSFTLHLLAYHPEKQKKVQEEIDQVLARHDNKLCYDAVKEMTYLECAFKESMRILPSFGRIGRICSKTYTFPDIDLTIDKGVSVMIPVQAMQNDPKYFDNPEEFRPERFNLKELDNGKTKFVYLPFGDGPRACIADRLGLMQSLAGLAAVLSRFSVEPAPTSARHPVVDPIPDVVQSIKAGLPLTFRERKKEQ